MYTYSELAEFARANMATMTNAQMAEQLGVGRSTLLFAMNSHGVARYKAEFKWTPEMVDYLVANYRTMGDTEIAINLGMGARKANDKPCKRVEKKRWHMGLVRTPEEVQAIKEANYWNWNPAHVRKGDAHWHSRPIGTVAIHSKGLRNPYFVVKVAKGEGRYNMGNAGSWMPLREKVWRDAGREIPVGHVLRFVGTDPHDPSQFTVENLRLMTRAEHAKANREIWPDDLRRVVRLLKKLNKSIEDATK